MLRESADLWASFVVAGVSLLLIVSGSNGPILLLLGLPLALLLPGYAITAAIFANNPPGAAERAALALGLSLVVNVLGGFLLNLTAWGLQAVSWAVLNGGITFLAGGTALLRRLSSEMPESAARRGASRHVGAVLAVLALPIVVLALLVAVTGVLSQRHPGFTQLWLLPGAGADASTVRVGIRSSERSGVNYWLQLRQGEDVFFTRPPFELQTHEAWEAEVALPGGSAAGKVEARLYRIDSPFAVYRTAVLWIGDQPVPEQ
jgi:uncharacterized membrane protein